MGHSSFLLQLRNWFLHHKIQQEHTAMKSKRLRKGERASLDIISALPQTILETILCFLPTEEAARTSILSREWRYKWTKIPTLEFHLSQVSKRISKEKQVQGINMDTRCKPFYDLLYQILLLHQGPIHEFTLVIDLWIKDQDTFGFDQIVLHLSKNHTVKKLTILGTHGLHLYNLPISVFSLHHLTDLDLFCFDLDHQPMFNGFDSLRSLSLQNVGISTKTLLHLLSNCPSLKSFILSINEDHLDDRDCAVIELFKCLPMIEDLTTYSYVFQWLVLDSVPKELPTSLFHLKYFCLEDMCFVDGYGLGFLLVLIKCSPNLEKIKLKIDWDHDCYEEYPVVWEEYSDVWLEHLNELEIECFSNSTPEMEFVKFILARSPKLKKVSFIRCVVPGKEKLEMLEVLLRAPRASPVRIDVKSWRR
ncbi:hypothetical protein L1987_51679 [Smallanthus sonchifolius]|uniref:Uncharacterized protein n=1 Tax=Smallanthus sonchifolius TaxID=185202 RepID=A0ACB9ER19_9ASTR|nr:hypothetical protein L1987_51679 [Smallanthus sonchifolius]